MKNIVCDAGSNISVGYCFTVSKHCIETLDVLNDSIHAVTMFRNIRDIRVIIRHTSLSRFNTILYIVVLFDCQLPSATVVLCSVPCFNWCDVLIQIVDSWILIVNRLRVRDFVFWKLLFISTLFYRCVVVVKFRRSLFVLFFIFQNLLCLFFYLFLFQISFNKYESK